MTRRLRSIISFAVLLHAGSACCQNDQPPRPGTPVGWSVSLTPLMGQPSKIGQPQGSYIPKGMARRGGEIGIDVDLGIYRHFSIRTGMHFGVIGRSFELTIPAGDFTPPRSEDFAAETRFIESADLYLSLPLLLQQKWEYRHRRRVSIESGIRLQQYLPQPGTGIGSGTDPVTNQSTLDIQLDMDVREKIRTAPFAAIGHEWIRPGGNAIAVALAASLPAREIMNGSYRVRVPGRPDSFGKYGTTLAYFGVRLQYLFANKNR